jgi:adenine phosphoribosyltransferase
MAEKESLKVDLRAFIRDIPDFPKPGILFKDITPLLGNAEAFRHTIEALAQRYENGGSGTGASPFTKIVAIESRGFFFGAGLALRLGCGLVPVRKPGKLPAETVSQSFDLEYGKDTLEMHKDALKPGDRVLLVDDVLATGGTLEATAKLVGTLGATVHEIVTVIELTFLNGRQRIREYPYYACIQY